MAEQVKLKQKYRLGLAKQVSGKRSGNSGGVGTAGNRRRRGWRKRGSGPANVPHVAPGKWHTLKQSDRIANRER